MKTVKTLTREQELQVLICLNCYIGELEKHITECEKFGYNDLVDSWGNRLDQVKKLQKEIKDQDYIFLPETKRFENIYI